MYVCTENKGPSFSVSKAIARTDSQTDRHTDKLRETDSTDIITYPHPQMVIYRICVNLRKRKPAANSMITALSRPDHIPSCGN